MEKNKRIRWWEKWEDEKQKEDGEKVRREERERLETAKEKESTKEVSVVLVSEKGELPRKEVVKTMHILSRLVQKENNSEQ